MILTEEEAKKRVCPFLRDWEWADRNQDAIAPVSPKCKTVACMAWRSFRDGTKIKSGWCALIERAPE